MIGKVGCVYGVVGIFFVINVYGWYFFVGKLMELFIGNIEYF